MDLDLGDLRSFLALTEQLHFGRAAGILHISQPALSKQIRRMEERIGGLLLTRHPRGLTLTSAGQVLQQRAREILEQSEAAERLTRLALRGEAGTLRVGFGIATLASGLPNLLLRFRRRYPTVHVSVRDMSTPDQIQALSAGEIDVGFVRLPIRVEGIDAVPIINERLMMVLSSHLAHNTKRGLAALSRAPFVVCSRATSASFYDHVIRTCRAAGFVPAIVQEANELFTVLNLVRAGLGVSLAPSSARLMRVPQIHFADCRIREAQWTIGLAWNAGRQQTAIVENFMRLAREQYGAQRGERSQIKTSSSS
jgi:DNA-binding transcriptional LysR family regulator